MVRCFITELVLKVFLAVKPLFDCSVLYCAVPSRLSRELLVVVILTIIVISSSYIALLYKVSQSAFQRK